MPMEPSFLARCEEFLLHPTVRALSLAQRVDFLERKGLTPAEITACLKGIEGRDGLAVLTPPRPVHAAVNGPGGNGPWWASWLPRLGVPALATMLLAYGYVRLREAMLVKMLIADKERRARRRQQRNVRVLELLRTIAAQRSGYAELVTRLKRRISNLQTLSSTADNQTDEIEQQAAIGCRQELAALREQVAGMQAVVRERRAVTACHDVTPPSTAGDARGNADETLMASQTMSKSHDVRCPDASFAGTLTGRVTAHAAPLAREPHPDLPDPSELLDEKPRSLPLLKN